MADIAGNLEARGRYPWRIIGWGGAVALLLLPFVVMQFSQQMNWGAEDFIFVGVVIGTVGLLFELAVRVSSNWSYRAAFGLALLGIVLVVWANVAVGIVGSDDNPNNALFFWALLLGVAGAAVARLRAHGMAWAMAATALALWIAFAVAVAGPTDEPHVPHSLEFIGISTFALIILASAALFRRVAQSSSSS
jgi:peptidoglycan/LPS O-acetylase OafA/YrhL